MEECHETYCYCHMCEYEVVCGPCDVPDGEMGPVPFYPVVEEEEEDEVDFFGDEDEWCYCHKCKYEVLCCSGDLPDGETGPIKFVPLVEEEEEW